MTRDARPVHAGLRRRVEPDTTCHSRRRALLIAAAAWPLMFRVETARPQPKQAPIVIGWLDTSSRKTSEHRLAAFKENFSSLGWQERTGYQLVERWADGRTALLPQMVAEIAAAKPAVIVAAPTQAVVAAGKAAPGIPIVQANGDPLASGLVMSLARPGGMVTGLSNVNSEISEKFIELLLVAAPKLRRVGFLVDPSSPAHGTVMRAVRRSVERHQIEARFAEATRPEDIEPAIARLAKDGFQALVAMSSAWFVAERQRIVRLALAQRWPLVAPQSEFADEGALLSYGVDRTALYRRAAYYVDRILKGAKPGELPIELPTKFELVVNARTAKALGLAISPELRLRADRIIE